jgi:hypothetical protein
MAGIRQQWTIPLDKIKTSSIQVFGERRVFSKWPGKWHLEMGLAIASD